MSESSTASSPTPPPSPPSEELQWPFRENNFRNINEHHPPSVILRHHAGFTAEILLYGGQVISWTNNNGEELLFLSERANYTNGIRGGISIYNGDLEEHGIARTLTWRIEDLTNEPNLRHTGLELDEAAFVDLVIDSNQEDIQNWPYGGKCFSFKFAFHTCFSISNISDTEIEGSEAVEYLDFLHDGNRFIEGDEPIVIDDKVDRMYLDISEQISVRDNQAGRTFTISKSVDVPDVVT
ncbi:hypothetical protein ACP275_11G084700 [Erythranthe tilingii]